MKNTLHHYNKPRKQAGKSHWTLLIIAIVVLGFAVLLYISTISSSDKQVLVGIQSDVQRQLGGGTSIVLFEIIPFSEGQRERLMNDVCVGILGCSDVMLVSGKVDSGECSEITVMKKSDVWSIVFVTETGSSYCK